VITAIVIIAALYLAFHIGRAHPPPLPQSPRPGAQLLLVVGARPLRQRAAARRIPGRAQGLMRQRFYSERGRPVEVITWWAGRGPRNVLIRRADGQLVVRPFRGLRRLASAGAQSSPLPADSR